MSKDLIVLFLFSLITISYSFDKEKILKEKLGNISDAEMYQRLGIEKHMTPKESLLFYTQAAANSDNNCNVRKDFDIPDIFMFMPIMKAKFFNVGEKANFANHCFQKTRIEVIGYSAPQLRIQIEVSNPAYSKCQDTYLFHTLSILTPKMIVRAGVTNFDLIVEKEKFEVIKTQGLRVFSLCEGLLDTARSIIATYYFIKGGDTLDENGRHQTILTTNNLTDSEHEKSCLDFHEKYTGERPQYRTGHAEDVLPVADYIKSGDYFGLNVITGGESCLINYMTGGAISHAAIAIRMNGELKVLESTDGGILFTPWDKFIQDVIKTNHTLMWFPLSEENSKKFNTTKAYEWFKSRIGLPYGMKAYAVPAYDVTTNDTLPEYMSPEVLTMAVDILEQFGIKDAIDSFVETVNVRLGTKGLDMEALGLELTKRNLVYEEVLAWPEKDEYIYSNGENWVCSALVVKVYQEAGVLPRTIKAKEFVPRDIYQLKIFDENFINTRPEICKEAEPNVNWCQIYGKYRKTPYGYNSIEVYPNMNERCPFRPPKYFRPDGC